MQIYCICGAWETRTPHLDTAFYSINKALSLPAGFIVEAKSLLASSRSSQMS